MIHVCNTIQLYLHFVTQIQFSCGFFCRSFSGHDYTVNRINLRIPWYDLYSIKVIAAEKYYYYWSSYGDIFFLFINCSFTRDISVRRKPWLFKLKIEILTTYQYCNYGDSFLFTNYGGSVRSPNSQSFNQWRPQTKH